MERTEKNYYAVECKGGHVGLNRFMPITIYVAAEDGRDAAFKARYTPRVKHDHKDCIRSVRKITEIEYQEGLTANNMDPYFFAKNVQEQRMYPEIYERALEETEIEKLYKKKHHKGHEKQRLKDKKRKNNNSMLIKYKQACDWEAGDFDAA